MNMSTFYVYELLQCELTDSGIIKELVTLDNNNLISHELLLYVLKKKNIPFSLYEMSLSFINSFPSVSEDVLVPN